MLKVENLRFGYVPTVDIFRNVNFTIHEGEFIAVGGKMVVVKRRLPVS